jgi:hypothetical protein
MKERLKLLAMTGERRTRTLKPVSEANIETVAPKAEAIDLWPV